jgi:AcrR family transcriptional regulator
VGRRKRTEIRREEIAHVVLELIASEGHEALSMVAVAKRIGVVPSALYRHFPCKEDMIIAAMQLHRDERLGEIDRMLQAHASIIEAYTEFVSHVPCFIGQTAALPRIGFGILPNASERLRKEAQSMFACVLQRITEDFERAQQIGEIAAGVDCRAAANAMWGVMVTAVIRYNIFGPDFDVVNHVQLGWELFLRAVRPGAATLAASNHREKTPVPEARK